MRRILLAAAALGVWGGTELARAQDGNRGHGHAQYHDWYKELKNSEGVECCNAHTAQGDGDCRPVSARPRENGWEAYFNGRWNRIPQGAILPDSMNKVPLYSHICEQSGYVHCFLKGGGGS
jgi:hypothetical protein